MRRRIALTTAALALAALPPTAGAQEPPPAPAQGTLTLTAERVGPAKAVTTGQRFRIRGVLTPSVAGQSATVRVYRGNAKVMVKQVALLPSSTGRSAYFVTGYTSKRPGRLTVRASHLATPELATTVAKPVAVDVLPSSLRAGAKGTGVRLMQQHLARLGYVVGRRGVLDARTARAVLAFRKVSGMARVAAADRAFFRRLRSGGGVFRVRHPNHGRHVEADLSAQVIALIEGGKVRRIYPTSSGAPATPTVLGSFRVYRKDPGTNALGMVHSSYFIRGYAIHGYKSVPIYPASHGCLRVPVPDALSIFRWVRHGNRVDVYYRGKARRSPKPRANAGP